MLPKTGLPRWAVILGCVFGFLFLLYLAGAISRCQEARERAAPRATSSSPGASVRPPASTQDSIEQICGLSSDFAIKYVERTRERQDMASTPRLAVKVSVPSGLSAQELQANLCHAAVATYRAASERPGALTVFAYTGLNLQGAYNAGRLVYAPDGRWENADPSVDLSKWRFTFDSAKVYFDTSAPIADGTTVTLTDTGTVSISRSATSWNDADIVARVPSGTKALIRSHREFNMGPDQKMLRYEVETTTGPKAVGWVAASAVRPVQ